MDRFLDQVHQLIQQQLSLTMGHNDGSQELIIEKICSANPKYHYGYLKLDRNHGLEHGNQRRALMKATTDLVGYIDSDIQTTPTGFSEIPRILSGV